MWSIVLTPLELGSSRSRSCWGRDPVAAFHRGGGPAGSTGELWRGIEGARDRDTEIKIHVQKEKGRGRKEVGRKRSGKRERTEEWICQPFYSPPECDLEDARAYPSDPPPQHCCLGS